MTYFKLDEFLKSATADKYHIKNTPTTDEINNIEYLVENILDPLREAYGHPIAVTSGFRCDELNAKVGGSRTSDHRKGMAADIRVYKRNAQGKSIVVGGNRVVDKEGNKRLFELVQELHLPFKQLINEYDFSWVHVSYDPDADTPRRQILNIV